MILIICLFVGGFCAYQAWQIYNEDNEVELQTDKIKKECIVKKDENGEQILAPDWNALKAINPLFQSFFHPIAFLHGSTAIFCFTNSKVYLFLFNKVKCSK